jgi:hypothetical protein
MIDQFHLTPQNRPYLYAKLEALDPHRQWVVTVRERKSKRTIDQNRRLWDLYGAIGAYIGEDKDKVHELMGYKFLRYQDTVAGESVELIKSTTKLTTAEMAEYQDAIERWAAGIGFYWEAAA